jgi:hypothetical protein
MTQQNKNETFSSLLHLMIIVYFLYNTQSRRVVCALGGLPMTIIMALSFTFIYTKSNNIFWFLPRVVIRAVLAAHVVKAPNISQQVATWWETRDDLGSASQRA